MVHFETRVNGAVQADAHRQYGHGQGRVAARVRRGDQRYRRTKLTWKEKKKMKNYFYLFIFLLENFLQHTISARRSR